MVSYTIIPAHFDAVCRLLLALGSEQVLSGFNPADFVADFREISSAVSLLFRIHHGGIG